MFQPSPHKDEIIQALREGVAQGISPSELIAAVTARFPVSKKTVGRYFDQLKAGKLDQTPKGPALKSGGELAVVLQPSVGAIVFTLGEHKISLSPQHLYDAYLYYEDIVVRHDIDEEFSLAIKDSMKYVWERLNQHKGEKEGISITMEES